jgi:rhodanese-related sulfurtransferase
VKGYLDAGMWAWDRAGRAAATIRQVPVDELKHLLAEQPLQVVDVRQPGEYAAGHIPGAVNIPLGVLKERLAELDPARPTVSACQGGYRSMAAASLLQRAEFKNLFDLAGGTAAWVNAGGAVSKQ